MRSGANIHRSGRAHPASSLLGIDGWRSVNDRPLMFFAFDLPHQDGVDLRHLPLSERKRDLDRLCR